MKSDRFTDVQIMGVICQTECGISVPDLCREHGISNATFYRWRAKYGGMDASMISQMQALEDENRRLKRMYADLIMQTDILKEALEKIKQPAQRRELAAQAVHASFVLDALEQVIHARCPFGGSGLIHTSDRGSQYVAIRYTGCLAEVGIESSVGSVGALYDNALAETINGLFKAAVIHRRWSVAII